MRLYFSMPQGSVSAVSPVVVTLVAPYLELQQGNRSAGLTNVTQTGGTAANSLINMTVSAPGEYYITVRNATTGSNNVQRTQRQSPKYLQAEGFNDSDNLND